MKKLMLAAALSALTTPVLAQDATPEKTEAEQSMEYIQMCQETAGFAAGKVRMRMENEQIPDITEFVKDPKNATREEKLKIMAYESAFSFDFRGMALKEAFPAAFSATFSDCMFMLRTGHI